MTTVIYADDQQCFQEVLEATAPVVVVFRSVCCGPRIVSGTAVR